MINVSVSTVWQGKVGINEKYVSLAIANGQGLYIQLTTNGEVMEIPPDQIETAQVGRSERRFRDKYGEVDYLLVYYKWVPTAKQGVLV